MKKTFLFLILVLSISLIGCSASQDNSTNADPVGQPNTGEISKVKLEIGYVTTPNESDPYHVAADKFKQIVEEKTNGQIEVVLYPNGQLGQEREVIEAMQLGTVGGGVFTNAYLSGFDPKFQLFDFPFLFTSEEEAHKVADSEVGEALLESLEQINVKGLAFAEGGFRHMMNNVRPIKTLEDAKGVKFRSMESPIYLEMFQTLGANPAPLNWGEVYTAAQLGVVDGLECPIPVYHQSKLQEVTKYVSLTRHTYSPLVIAISMNSWNEIPADLQPIVKEAAVQAAQEQRSINVENTQALLEMLKSEGVEVNELDNPEEFREVSLPVYQAFEDEIGKDLVDKTMNILGIN